MIAVGRPMRQEKLDAEAITCRGPFEPLAPCDEDGLRVAAPLDLQAEDARLPHLDLPAALEEASRAADLNRP